MRIKQRLAILLLAAGAVLAGLILYQSRQSRIKAPPQFFRTTYAAAGHSATYNYINVALNDPATGISALGAANRLPVNDASWEPRWQPAGDAIQDALGMYNGSGVAERAVLINTDYFCREEPGSSREACSGHGGSPQGLFVHHGTVYHRAPTTTLRAALIFSAAPQASIRAMGWASSTAGISEAVSGGPIVLQGGMKICNPERSDLEFRCGADRQARSAACISADGSTLWLIVTARGSSATWLNLATFMQSQLACADGMQFDGGLSVSLIVGGSAVAANGSIGSGLLISYAGDCGPCVAAQPTLVPAAAGPANARTK